MMRSPRMAKKPAKKKGKKGKGSVWLRRLLVFFATFTSIFIILGAATAARITAPPRRRRS